MVTNVCSEVILCLKSPNLLFIAERKFEMGENSVLMREREFLRRIPIPAILQPVCYFDV